MASHVSGSSKEPESTVFIKLLNGQGYDVPVNTTDTTLEIIAKAAKEAKLGNKEYRLMLGGGKT